MNDISWRAPFPPPDLMHIVSGLTSEADFAQHGRDIFSAMSAASPSPLLDFPSILDFGIGSGRLARMFLEYTGSYLGVDVDARLVDWVNASLPWVKATTIRPRSPLPYEDCQFDCVISVSVFTHMNEADSLFYLGELHRVSKPGGRLLLTVHGQRAIERGITEPAIEKMFAIEASEIAAARDRLAESSFSFTLQNGHLTTDDYEYGISFTSEAYIRREWAKLFQRRSRGARRDLRLSRYYRSQAVDGQRVK